MNPSETALLTDLEKKVCRAYSNTVKGNARSVELTIDPMTYENLEKTCQGFATGEALSIEVRELVEACRSADQELSTELMNEIAYALGFIAGMTNDLYICATPTGRFFMFNRAQVDIKRMPMPATELEKPNRFLSPLVQISIP